MANKKRSSDKSLTHKQLSHHAREARAQRTLIWSAVGVALLIVAILGYGIITEAVIKPRTPVARVGDTKITAKLYAARVRYERLTARFQLSQYQTYLNQIDTTDPSMQAFAQQLQQAQTDLENQLSPEFAVLFGGEVLDQIIEEQLVLQATEERGLSVSEEEIERNVEQFIGYDRDAAAEAAAAGEEATETITATQQPMTQAEYQEASHTFKTDFLQVTGLSEADFRRMLATKLLIPQLQAALAETLETEVDQVQVTYLTAGTEEAAQALNDRVAAGEDLTALTEELREDDDELTNGGSLPWSPLESLTTQFGEVLAPAAFDTPVGELTAPLQGPSGDRYYVLYIEGHEVQPLSEYLLQQQQQQNYDEWLKEQQAAYVEYLDWQDYTPTEP